MWKAISSLVAGLVACAIGAFAFGTFLPLMNAVQLAPIVQFGVAMYIAGCLSVLCFIVAGLMIFEIGIEMPSPTEKKPQDSPHTAPTPEQ